MLVSCMYVCAYVWLHRRIHKDIDTCDNRDRLKPAVLEGGQVCCDYLEGER